MAIERVHDIIASDTQARAIPVIMDKFAIYLAFHDGRNGAKFTRNTLNTYFGNAKNWLMDQYPLHRPLVTKSLQGVANRLSKYCAKREAGTTVKKAPPCTKSDLDRTLRCVYKYGSLSSDYLDGLLLVLMWYLFGGSSDLHGITSSDISIYPGGALYVSFTRMKTTDVSGLTLYRDRQSFTTCPIFAFAAALAMKRTSNRLLLDQIPRADSIEKGSNTEFELPLVDMLKPALVNSDQPSELNAPLQRRAGLPSPSVHGHVNRMLGGLGRTRQLRHLHPTRSDKVVLDTQIPIRV